MWPLILFVYIRSYADNHIDIIQTVFIKRRKTSNNPIFLESYFSLNAISTVQFVHDYDDI